MPKEEKRPEKPKASSARNRFHRGFLFARQKSKGEIAILAECIKFEH